MKVTVERKTAESKILVVIDDGPRKATAKKDLKSPIIFFNHMLEQLVWRSELNIAVDVELDHFYLSHVVCEDVGITLGRAFKDLIGKKQEEGIKGYGFALATIDEALSRAVVSFESRAYLDLNFNDIEVPQATEGMQSEDLVAFWEGFVQGAQAAVHIDLLKGRAHHGHHHWESMFRAAGEALREAIDIRPWRQDMAAGVAGKIDFKVDIEEKQ